MVLINGRGLLRLLKCSTQSLIPEHVYIMKDKFHKIILELI